LDNSVEHIEELIGKYLAGEASPDEAAWIKTWAAQNEANRKYLEHFEIIFQRASTIQSQQQFDTDAAWKSVRSKLRQPGAKTVPIKPAGSGYSFFLKIAASILVVMIAGFFAYRAFWQNDDPNRLAVGTQQGTLNDTLPDGSSVFLNKQTKIDYAFDKKEKTHRVKLRGEAYFHIQHAANDDKQFLVETDGIYIRDIGTSFNVTAYPESNTVEVIVEEGEVHFFTENDPGIYLKANGKGVYNKTTKTFTIEQPESNVLAYKTRFFSFSNTGLVEVAEALNGVYDKKIVLGDKVKDCHLTVSFNNENISEIAQVIAETLGLQVKESEHEILLEGPGCEQ
jgi:transmembrane sensor